MDSIRDAYNKAALVYLDKYEARGVRTEDVDLTMSYLQTLRPHVLEIGYGGGIEAEYILTKTDRYLGIDIADSYQEIAQKRVPQARFVCANVHDYEFPSGIDVVFAFASLLHSNKLQMQDVLLRLHDSLNQGGVIFQSLNKT